MATTLYSETAIQASPLRVWDILTDFSAYPEWNPFIRRIVGTLETGARLDVQLQLARGPGVRMRPTVQAVDPSRELCWRGHLGIPGLFDGEHRFRIEAVGTDRVRFVQEEHFTGLLAPLFLRFIAHGTRQGFEAMNQALKTRAEQFSSSR